MNPHRHPAEPASFTAATRKFAVAAGVCYLITHVTSVSAPFLYGASSTTPVP